jgi:hypothetical protein
MNQIETLEKAIKKIGLSNIARTLTEKNGRVFTPQQVNNWRKRGVPYKWSDTFAEIAGVNKKELRND